MNKRDARLEAIEATLAGNMPKFKLRDRVVVNMGESFEKPRYMLATITALAPSQEAFKVTLDSGEKDIVVKYAHENRRDALSDMPMFIGMAAAEYAGSKQKKAVHRKAPIRKHLIHNYVNGVPLDSKSGKGVPAWGSIPVKRAGDSAEDTSTRSRSSSPAKTRPSGLALRSRVLVDYHAHSEDEGAHPELMLGTIVGFRNGMATVSFDYDPTEKRKYKEEISVDSGILAVLPDDTEIDDRILTRSQARAYSKGVELPAAPARDDSFEPDPEIKRGEIVVGNYTANMKVEGKPYGDRYYLGKVIKVSLGRAYVQYNDGSRGNYPAKFSQKGIVGIVTKGADAETRKTSIAPNKLDTYLDDEFLFDLGKYHMLSKGDVSSHYTGEHNGKSPWAPGGARRPATRKPAAEKPATRRRKKLKLSIRLKTAS